MDGAVFVAISGFAGAVVGAATSVVLNEVANVYRQRREDKRQLRRVLFGLLSIWHHLRPFRVDFFVTCVNDWAKTRSLDGVSYSNRRQLQDVIDKILKESVEPLVERARREGAECYEAAVQAVSFVRPLLAHQLSGWSRVQEGIDRYYDDVRRRFATEIDAKAERILGHMQNDVTSEACQRIEGDIFMVASEIGGRTHRETGEFLDERKKSSDEELRKLLYDKLDAILDLAT